MSVASSETEKTPEVFKVEDVESYRMNSELPHYWRRRKEFLLAHHQNFPFDRLIALSNCFINVEYLGVTYHDEVMKQIKELKSVLAEPEVLPDESVSCEQDKLAKGSGNQQSSDNQNWRNQGNSNNQQNRQSQSNNQSSWSNNNQRPYVPRHHNQRGGNNIRFNPYNAPQTQAHRHSNPNNNFYQQPRYQQRDNIRAPRFQQNQQQNHDQQQSSFQGYRGTNQRRFR